MIQFETRSRGTTRPSRGRFVILWSTGLVCVRAFRLSLALSAVCCPRRNPTRTRQTDREMEYRRSGPSPLARLLSLLSLLPHASGLSTAAVLPLRAPGRLPHRPSCVAVATTTSLEPSGLEPVAAQLRLSGLRRVYGEYAERCDEYASSVEGPVARFATRPIRWVRALFPKPRPLAQLSMCEGGTFKVRREGLSRVMVFEEEGCEIPDFDLL